MYTPDLKTERGLAEAAGGATPKGTTPSPAKKLAKRGVGWLLPSTPRGALLLVAFSAVLIVIALFVSSVSTQGEEKGQEAMLMVANLSPDAPSVDIYVDDQLVGTPSGVPFKTVSPYLAVPAGNQNVKVYSADAPAGSEPLLEADVELDEEAYYTFGIVGCIKDGSLAAKLYDDNNYLPEEGKAKLRVIHAVPDIGPAIVDVKEDGNPFGLPGFSNASDYAEVPAGAYTLAMRAAGTNEAALKVPSVTLEAGKVYTAFAVGRFADGSLDVALITDNEGGNSFQPPPDTGSSGTEPGTTAGETTAHEVQKPDWRTETEQPTTQAPGTDPPAPAVETANSSLPDTTALDAPELVGQQPGPPSEPTGVPNTPPENSVAGTPGEASPVAVTQESAPVQKTVPTEKDDPPAGESTTQTTREDHPAACRYGRCPSGGSSASAGGSSAASTP